MIGLTPLPEMSSISPNHAKADSFSLRLFGPLMRSSWLVVMAVTVISEVYPFPLLPPVPFYTIWAIKLLFFFVLGYLAPLTFWRFNALNRGVGFAALSASFVEVLQGSVGHGHSFHWYELLVKLALILLGFVLALEAIYDRKISIGPLRIALTGEHLRG
jgi:hypothetical protein